MDKDKLVNALNAIQNGNAVGQFRDEMETIITLVMNASDEAIADAWDDLKSDTE